MCRQLRAGSLRRKTGSGKLNTGDTHAGDMEYQASLQFLGRDQRASVFVVFTDKQSDRLDRPLREFTRAATAIFGG